MLGVEDDLRALALGRDPRGGQFAVHALDLVVVETLSERLVKADSEPVVDRLERRQARLVDPVPKGEVLRVAGLELHELGARLLHDAGVRLGGGVAQLVEALEFLDRVAGERSLVEVALAGPDQLAVLGSPVADMVVAHDPGPGEGEEPRQMASPMTAERRWPTCICLAVLGEL